MHVIYLWWWFSYQMSFCPRLPSHRVFSDKIHHLLFTLSYFRPDRFVQLLSLIPILILLLYLIVSKDLVYNGISTGFCIEERKRQLHFNLNYISWAETKNSFSITSYYKFLSWIMTGLF